MNSKSDERALEGQRRQVTVLFADMADYTPTAERLGEEATYALMSRIIEAMSEEVHAHDGTVQNFTGDGVMALFGAPVAIEDAPLKACRAALGIQERMRALEDGIEADHGVRPKFRIGIHTGPLIVGKVGDSQQAKFTALGDTVNLASRLESEAEAGGTLLSEATHLLVDGYVASAFAGERDIKGKSDPQRLYALEGLKAAVTRFDVSLSRGLTAMVGRDRELNRLRQCWEEAGAGRLRLVDIVGEAGIGKSRLVHEFLEGLDAERVSFLQGRCSSQGTSTPFLPFIEVVRTAFRMGDRMNSTEVERRLNRGLESLGIEVEETLPYLLNLLGQDVKSGVVNELDSEVVGLRTRNALHALVRERCRVSPTILFIDDLHWMDRASEELLGAICERDPDLPLLLVCAYRPGYAAPWAARAEENKIRLDQLPRDATVELLKNRLEADAIPDQLVRLVSEKAEGNPLFAEEIVNYLLEKKAIATSDRSVTYTTSDIGALPVTLENLLMDRFDRLDPRSREVLEAAAVIGANFRRDIVEAVLEPANSVAERLLDLEKQGLILREPDEDAHRFKHALVREAIYDSLLKPKRERLHTRAATAIEQIAGQGVGEFADVLAHHYTRTSNAAKAVHYLALAGERSLIVYSLEEAEARFREAIDRVEEAPGSVDDAVLVDVLLKLSRVLYFRIDFFGIIALVDRYLSVAERLGDERRLARLLFEAGYAHVFAAQHEIGKPMLERALAIGEEIDDPETIGYASMGLMWHYQFWERTSAETHEMVMRYFEAGHRIGEELRDVWLASKALAGVSIYYNSLGRPDQSRKFALRLMEYSRATNDPRPRAMGLWAISMLNALYFNYDEAVANADEAIAIGLSPVDRALAGMGKGMALTMLGRTDEGERLLATVRAQLWDGGLRNTLTVLDLAYGLAMVINGDLARGVRWIEDSMRRVIGWGYQLGGATGNLFLGEIYLRMALGEEKPPPTVMLRNLGFLLRTLPFARAKARRHLETAASLSRQYDIPAVLSWSLWNLGRLHAAKKRYDEASACLDEARELAQSIDEPVLIERIDQTSATLPALA